MDFILKQTHNFKDGSSIEKGEKVKLLEKNNTHAYVEYKTKHEKNEIIKYFWSKLTMLISA